MLDIPDELFGNSFTMVTNISKLFGDLMMVCNSLQQSHLGATFKLYSKANLLRIYRIQLVDTRTLYNTSNHC